jgi:hypothetical protein
MEIAEFFQGIKVPVTVLHVIAVIFGMGGALVSDVLFSFFGKDKKLNATEISTLSLLANIVFYSLILIVISGAAILVPGQNEHSHGAFVERLYFKQIHLAAPFEEKLLHS